MQIGRILLKYNAGTITVAGIVLGCLLSCSPPPTGTNDPHTAFPIEVEYKTFTTQLSFSEIDDLIVIENPNQFIGFIQTFHRAATSRITVSAHRTNITEGNNERISGVLTYLNNFGIQHSQVEVDISDTLPRPNDPDVLLSFHGTAVKVPECGDWSGEAGYNPTNLPTKNHGCAYQRNIGLMVSNPADLESSDHGSMADSQMLQRIIDLYRAGEETSIPGVQHPPALGTQ